MDKNNGKEGTKPLSEGSESRPIMCVLITTMLVLFFIVVSASIIIGFTVEYYKLKSEVTSLRNESSPAVQQQQLGQNTRLNNDTIKRLNASLNQLKECCSRYSELYKIDGVNASLTTEISDGYSALYEKIEPLNATTSMKRLQIIIL